MGWRVDTRGGPGKACMSRDSSYDTKNNCVTRKVVETLPYTYAENVGSSESIYGTQDD